MSGVTPDIIKKCLKGRRKAQNMLYNQYCDAMFSICKKMLGNRADAEDVLQISFVDVFRKLHQYRFEASIGSWIKRIVINNCLSFLRNKKALLEIDDNVTEVVEEPIINENYNDYSVEKIKRYMINLSDGYRVILTMYLFEGLTHKEIGEYLNITETTSKTQYHRAKKKLIELMNK